MLHEFLFHTIGLGLVAAGLVLTPSASVFAQSETVNGEPVIVIDTDTASHHIFLPLVQGGAETEVNVAAITAPSTDDLELRVNTQVARLQRLLSPSTMAAYRQAAARLTGPLPSLFNSSSDLKAQLMRQIEQDRAVHGVLSSGFLAGPIVGTLIGQAIGSYANGDEEVAAAKEKVMTVVRILLPQLEQEEDTAFLPNPRRP